MLRFSKILIPIFLALFISAGFAIFHFSIAQNNENNVSQTATSNQGLIQFESSDSFPEGTVYVCPEAASLEEINPRCPGKKILKLGETIDGLTLTTTNYEGQDYYLVLGFENGGGAVNLPPTADTGGPYEGYGGLPITLNASSSTDPNGDPLQYRWDFENDGTWDTDWLSISTTTHIWNNDYEGIVKLEVNDGEFTTIATTSVKVKSPRSFKQDAILELENLKTNDQKLNKKIDIIVGFINQSLNEDFWIDSPHLVFFEKGKWKELEEILKEDEIDLDEINAKGTKTGISVFHYEKDAVRLMMVEPGKTEKLESVFEEVIKKLVKADTLLAKVSIYDAKNTPVQNPKFKKIVEFQIKKAEEELLKAKDELEKGRPDKAITRMGNSWLHSQIAIKFAKLKE